MTSQSFLNDATAILVADTSVAINLNATGFFHEILNAIPNRIVITQQVLVELQNNHSKSSTNSDAIFLGVKNDRIGIVDLSNAAAIYFLDLVSGSALQTLDDGEAATIAYAHDKNAIALLDERKANKVCATRFEKLRVGSTVDLLHLDCIQATLGKGKFADAVFNALYIGRMRVPCNHFEWIISILGQNRADRCISLPKSIRKT